MRGGKRGLALICYALFSRPSPIYIVHCKSSIVHIPFDSIFYAKRISDYVLNCSSLFFSVLHQKRYLEWLATDWSSDFTEKVWQKSIWYLGRKKVHLFNHFSMTTAFAFYLTVIKLCNKSWKLQVEMCCLLELCNFPGLFNTTMHC